MGAMRICPPVPSIRRRPARTPVRRPIFRGRPAEPATKSSTRKKGRAWDILKDTQPDTKEHKAFIPQSAAAANPICLQCKTQDHILKWAYMGDPLPGAQWSRTSNVVELAQDHHLKAHILWEFWTAENSDGFHNPDMARESLTRSVDESQKGIKLLNEAIAAKTAAAK